MLSRRKFALAAASLPFATSVRGQGLFPPAAPSWGPPFSRAQLEDAQKRFAVAFPPDLFDFLLQRRFARGPDWSKDDEATRALLAWPLEGLLTDVERNDLWPAYWGPRPASLSARLEKAAKLVSAAPRLIPLGPNRYMPELPRERGNPVFFVFLGDVRYLGADLDDYVARLSSRGRTAPRLKKPIPFWTQLSEVRLQPPKAIQRVSGAS